MYFIKSSRTFPTPAYLNVGKQLQIFWAVAKHNTSDICIVDAAILQIYNCLFVRPSSKHRHISIALVDGKNTTVCYVSRTLYHLIALSLTTRPFLRNPTICTRWHESLKPNTSSVCNRIYSDMVIWCYSQFIHFFYTLFLFKAHFLSWLFFSLIFQTSPRCCFRKLGHGFRNGNNGFLGLVVHGIILMFLSEDFKSYMSTLIKCGIVS